MYDIAISYSRRQGDIAEVLLHSFSAKDWRVFMDKKRLVGAVHAQLHEAFTNSRVVVALISPDYCASEWCRVEASLDGVSYIPVVLEETDVSLWPVRLANSAAQSLTLDGEGRIGASLIPLLTVIENMLADKKQPAGEERSVREYNAKYQQIIENAAGDVTFNPK